MYCYVTKSFHETGDRRMSPFDYDFPFPNPECDTVPGYNARVTVHYLINVPVSMCSCGVTLTIAPGREG